MALVVKRLERAHRTGTWYLPPQYTYVWFCRVQSHFASFTESTHTLHAMMSSLLLIVQQLAHEPSCTLAEALEKIVREKRTTCVKSLSQVVRRLYAVANVVWHELLGELSGPLQQPRLPLSMRSRTDELDKQIFSDSEVNRIMKAAPAVSAYADALVRLLFATGIRIGAVAHIQCRLLFLENNLIRWGNILNVDGHDIQGITIVKEKGNRPRVLLLPEDVRIAMLKLVRTGRDGRVFPLSVRQLRNIFYAACKKAGVEGAHCHPHTARHTLVHRLFRLPASRRETGKRIVRCGELGVADCKVPGTPHGAIHSHTLQESGRMIETTERYYLRLSFQEIMERIQLPWSIVKPGETPSNNNHAPNNTDKGAHNQQSTACERSGESGSIASQ